jgi:hypothetical protein
MFGSQILDVVIGLVYVYLILGLVCTVANEVIARIFALRARTLEAGIQNMLEGKSPHGQTEWVELLYIHPLIKSLYKKGRFDQRLGRPGGPSYIPPRNFALALFDTLLPTAEATRPKTIQEMLQLIATLPDSQTKRALQLLVDEAGDDLKQARLNVEQWFNDAMERVSGWYKRKIQLIALVVALLISVGANADTLAMTNSLYRDPTLRASMVAAAEEIARQPELKANPDVAQTLQNLQLIGWSASDRPSRREALGWWTSKIFGLFVTTLAVSQGAPFWFDVLKKLINLRSSGKPTEEPA